MANQDRDIAVEYIFVHVYRVTSVSGSEVYHVLLVLTVMTDDLTGMPELVE